MSKKPLRNDELEALLTPDLIKKDSWEGLDPAAKRSGVRSFTIQLNDYEWAVIEEAAKKEGLAKAAFIRQSAVKKSRSVLDI
jgi:hypothetical protein